MLTVVCASNRSGVTNWFRSIVGRHKDGGGVESVPIPGTDRLPKLQLWLHNTTDRTGPLQLPDAGWGHHCEFFAFSPNFFQSLNLCVRKHTTRWNTFYLNPTAYEIDGKLFFFFAISVVGLFLDAMHKILSLYSALSNKVYFTFFFTLEDLFTAQPSPSPLIVVATQRCFVQPQRLPSFPLLS